MIPREKSDIIISVLSRHDATEIGVFGSFARGEHEDAGDIDILVEFSTKKSLFDMVEIEQELSEALGIKVDLLTRRSISPYMIDNIERDLVVLT